MRTKTRTVKCKVFTDKAWRLSETKHKPVFTIYDVERWSEEVGWDHITGSDCDLPRCVSARNLIKAGAVYLDDKKQIRFDWEKYNEYKKSFTVTYTFNKATS